MAAVYLPGPLVAGLLLMFRRKKLMKKGWPQRLVVLAVLLTGLTGLVACGNSPSSSSQTTASGARTPTNFSF
jgi:hypothetical protein